MNSAGLEAAEAALPIDSSRTLGGQPPIGWQRLWLAAQRRPWRSLAVIPAGPGVRTERVARALAEAGEYHLGHAVELTDATSITLRQVRAITETWIERRGAAERVILALGPVLTSPASLALAQRADAAILCVALGEGSISEAQRAIEEIGKERFLGTVCLRRGGEDR